MECQVFELVYKTAFKIQNTQVTIYILYRTYNHIGYKNPLLYYNLQNHNDFKYIIVFIYLSNKLL